jgi:hypothetical protein
MGYDKLKAIENAKNYLKPGITFEILDKIALSQNDDQAAEQLQPKSCNPMAKNIK